MRLHVLFIASLLIAASAAADPPARAVRLNLTDGIVSFRPAGIDDWTDAMVNRPLIDGDELWTGDAGRAEMHIGSAAVRLAPSTSFGIVNHTDGLVQLRLGSGTINVRARHISADDVWEIDTPNAAVTLQRAGRYRVDVSEDGYTTLVTVRGGEAEVVAGDTAFAVRTGERAEISGDFDATYDVAAAPLSDSFDRWCSTRDQREEQIAAVRYIPRDVVGYEDLDAYGEWRLLADFGWAWRPTGVAVGWAPYRYGHWAWIEPWGWTWIDDARWGFAPFHYGRWAHVDGAWFWIPGHIVRPTYAPALVAFGGDHGFHANVVLWWPLAPGEVYDPRKTNYRNQHVAGGVTAVPHDTFVGARPVAKATIAVSAAQAMSMKAIGTAPPVAPRSTSVRDSATTTVHPPQDVVTRRVIMRTLPPPPPLRFETKQEALTQTPGKPLSEVTEKQLRKETPPPTPSIVVPRERRTIKTPPATTTQPSVTLPTTTQPQTTTTYIPPRRKVPPPVTATTSTAPPPTTTTAAPPPRKKMTVAPPPTTTTTKTTTTTTTSTTTMDVSKATAKKTKAKPPEKENEKEKKKEQ